MRRQPGRSRISALVLLHPSYLITETDGPRRTRMGLAALMRGGVVTSTGRPASAFAVAEGSVCWPDWTRWPRLPPPVWVGARLRERSMGRPRGDLRSAGWPLAGVADDDLQWGDERGTAHHRGGEHAACLGDGPSGSRP